MQSKITDDAPHASPAVPLSDNVRKRLEAVSPASLEVYDSIVSQEEDALHLMQGRSAVRAAKRQERNDLRLELGLVRTEAMQRYRDEAAQRRLAAMQRAVAEAERQHDRAHAAVEEAQAAWTPLNQLRTNIEAFVRAVDPGRIVPHVVERRS